MYNNTRKYTHIVRWLTAICIVMFSPYLHAQKRIIKSRKETYSIDVNIYNRYDDHHIDTSYMGNRAVFNMLDSIMRDSVIIGHTKKINVVSSSSIEGSESYNRALSQRRMQTIEATFRTRYNYLSKSIWNFSYIAENWAHLRKAVSEDDSVPNRDKVLSIIDMEETHPDTREDLLKEMNEGIPWRYIHQHILPSSRGSVSMLFVPITLTPLDISKLTPIPNIKSATLELPTTTYTPLYRAIPRAKEPSYSRPIISLRSNLLLDITSTINIGAEIPLFPHWSISTEYINPWWQS